MFTALMLKCLVSLVSGYTFFCTLWDLFCEGMLPTNILCRDAFLQWVPLWVCPRPRQTSAAGETPLVSHGPEVPEHPPFPEGAACIQVRAR